MDEWLIAADAVPIVLASAEWFIIGGIIGLVLLGAVYAGWREKKRTRELEAVAQEQGFAFSAGHDAPLMDELLTFQLFSQGHGKKIMNVLTGQVEDTDFVIFDYRYTTGSGKHRTTHNQTVLLIRRPGWDLPRFYLRPESLFSKIGKVFGYDDINFDTHAEFSRRYNLSSPCRLAVQQLFSDTLLSFYEAQSGLCTEADAVRLILYRPGTRIAPADIPAFYALGWSLREALPEPAVRGAGEESA